MRLELATLLALVIPASTLFAPAARPVLHVPGVPVASSSRATVAHECAHSGIRHVLRRRDAAMCAAAGAEKDDQPGPVARSKAWVKKWAKFDKEKLKTLGVDAFFTYGVVSNINAGFTVALAWGTFSKASGLSPLAPGQWKAFLVTYAGIYATIGSILRPVRFAIAVSCTPLYSRLISRVRDSLPFRSTRPALNRTLSLVLVSLVLNVAGTCGILALGVWIAGVVTGVPAFPPPA